MRFDSTPAQNGRRRVSRLECQRRISTPVAGVLRDGRTAGSSSVEWAGGKDGDEGRLGVGVEVPKGESCRGWRKASLSNSGVISSGLGGSSIPSSKFSVDSDRTWLPLGRLSSEPYGPGIFGKDAKPDRAIG